MGGGARAAAAAAGFLVLTGCGSSGGGMSFGEMLLTGGASAPPEQAAGARDTYCPAVSVAEGGAALQAYSGGRVGDAAALRSQVTLGQLARECVLQADGSVLVRVGVEGRALQGAVGGPARFDVPVHLVVKSGSTVVTNRVRRAAVAIPAGDTQGSFAFVEEGIVVPPSAAQDFEIEVGLGRAPGPAAPSGPRRRG